VDALSVRPFVYGDGGGCGGNLPNTVMMVAEMF